MQPIFLVTFLCCAALLLQETAGITFDVASTKTRCVIDVLEKDVLVTGEFHVLTAESKSHVKVEVIGPYDKEVYSQENVRDGKFGFTSTTAGEYKACFTNEGMVQHSIQFKYLSGVEAKDLAGVIEHDHLKPIEAELLRLDEVLQGVRKEMLLLKEREANMRDTNESTNTRVTIFSFASVAIMSSLGLWQIFYLKKYFAEKKLI